MAAAACTPPLIVTYGQSPKGPDYNIHPVTLEKVAALIESVMQTTLGPVVLSGSLCPHHSGGIPFRGRSIEIPPRRDCDNPNVEKEIAVTFLSSFLTGLLGTAESTPPPLYPQQSLTLRTSSFNYSPPPVFFYSRTTGFPALKIGTDLFGIDPEGFKKILDFLRRNPQSENTIELDALDPTRPSTPPRRETLPPPSTDGTFTEEQIHKIFSIVAGLFQNILESEKNPSTKLGSYIKLAKSPHSSQIFYVSWHRLPPDGEDKVPS